MGKNHGKHVVFVYGTLLKGLSNHRVIESDCLIDAGLTVEKYRMTAGAVPFVSRRDPVCRIKGELYLVNDQILADLDRLEGHPIFYRREEIEVEFTGGAIIKAWIYFCENRSGRVLVDDGDYRKVAPSRIGWR